MQGFRFLQLGYHRLMSRYSASYDLEKRRNPRKIVQAQDNLLKKYRAVKNLICLRRRDVQMYLNHVVGMMTLKNIT